MDAAIEAAKTALESAREPFAVRSGQDGPASPVAQVPQAPQVSQAAQEPPAAAGADAADARPTVSLPVIPRPRPGLPADSSSARARARARRQAAAARRPPPGPGGARHPPRRMRGMLVTPWFAAGAGFVIAAALALNSPHTVLTYKPNMAPCAGARCQDPGALPTTRPKVQLNQARPAQVSTPPSRTRHHRTTPPAGPLVGFREVSQHNGEFAAIITIPAQQAQRGWNLRFRFPGRHVTSVWGALWHASPSGDGGLASILQPLQHTGPGEGHQGPPGQQDGPGQNRDSGHRGGSGEPGSSAQNGLADGGYRRDLRFLITVQGAPVTPVGCVLNQRACHFG
jgi:hypothetical protein